MSFRTFLRLAGALVLIAEIGFGTWQWRAGRDLRSRLAAARADGLALAGLNRRAADLEASLRQAADPRPTRREPGPTPGSFADRFSKALKDPAFLKKLSLAQQLMIAEHYGPLIARLQLTSAQQSRFVALLVEKQLAKTDAEAAANPMIGTGLMIPAITAAQQDVNAEIRQEIGPAAYQAYYDFEMTDGLRTTVRRLQQSLRYTSEPLSDAQAEAVVSALDRVTPPGERGGLAQFTGASVEVATGLATQEFSTGLPAQAVAAAQPLLSPPQMAEMQKLMRRQRDELQLRTQTLAALHAAQSAP